jgi:hypothetical protein
LAKKADVCPEMTGRNFELWQPLLALASWFESRGVGGLLKLMQEHALATIERGKDDQVADADEILLRILAERRANSETPQAKEILEAAQEEEEAGFFRSWSAKGVANTLKRYGITTSYRHGDRVYKTPLAELHRIQATYGLTLTVPDNFGSVA